jgi:hypothetical protein
MTPTDAKKIIEALANGIDPETGEVLPNDSALSQPQTIRALFLASKGLERMVNIPRAGQPWTDAEDKELLKSFDAGMPTDRIAKNHERTIGAIKARLLHHGRIIDNQSNYSNTSPSATAPTKTMNDNDIPF